MVDLKEWAENLQKEIYLFWEKNREHLSYGFAVFYSPVYKNPDILILGYNPGGKEDSFTHEHEKFQSGDFSLPKTLEYLTEDYIIARRMRSLFSSAGLDLDKLKIVKTNLIFFRTPSFKELDSINSELFKDIESFSKEKIKEIVNELKPKTILCEGISTFYKLIEFLGINEELLLKFKNSF